MSLVENQTLSDRVRIPAVGTKRRILRPDELVDLVLRKRRRILDVDRQIWSYNYAPIELMGKRANTINIRNINYGRYENALSARRGTLMTTQKAKKRLTRSDVFKTIYSVQHTDSHFMEFKSSAFQAATPCATTEHSQFPACQVQLVPNENISIFSSCTGVCSGQSAYATNDRNSVTLAKMINEFTDPRYGLPMYVVGPCGFSQTRNWVGSCSCEHPVDPVAFTRGHADDFVTYNPSNFVAAVYRCLQKKYSPFSGRQIQTAQQLVFDGGMCIGIGFHALSDMVEGLMACCDEMDKHPASALAASSKERQQNRKNQRGKGKAKEVAITITDLKRYLSL